MSEDQKAQLKQAAADMTVQQIADALMASKHGGAIEDPMAVAAYIKTL